MRAFGLLLALAACGGARPVPTPAVDDPLSQGTHRALLGGAELVYHVHGRGPVVIAVAGGPGFEWSYLRMPRVERSATVVYLELLGTGASARLADPKEYSRARDAADVDALRAHLGHDRAIVLGHSYGGFVALEWALAHPERVAALILYDTAPALDAESFAEVEKNRAAYRDQPWFADADAAWQQLDSAGSDAELAALFRRIAPYYVADYLGRRAMWDAYFAEARISVARSNGGTDPPYDVRPRLASIRAPTLVLVGAHDFICYPRHAEVMRDGIAGATLVRFEHSGHLAHLEEPEQFAAAVAEFVGSVGRQARTAARVDRCRPRSSAWSCSRPGRSCWSCRSAPTG